MKSWRRMERDNQLRVDKWLWYARFFKTRSSATRYVNSGHLRINSSRVKKANSLVKSGDILTFLLASRVRVLKVLLLTTKRLSAKEARFLYHDMSPTSETKKNVKVQLTGTGRRMPGSGRPTKRERRRLERFTNIVLE